MLPGAHRRWICLAKLLLDAEQGNWTASLCKVAFLKRSQKFSNSSSSSSDVFSNTAMTSVLTMLYTTKNEGWGERQRQRLPGGELSLPAPRVTSRTLSKFLRSTGESHSPTAILSATQMPQQVPDDPPASCDVITHGKKTWMDFQFFPLELDVGISLSLCPPPTPKCFLKCQI